MTTFRQIVDASAEVFGVTPDDITGPTRPRNHVLPRQCVMFIARGQGACLTSIGQHLGGRDHTTIMHGLKAWRKHRRDAAMRHLEDDVMGELGLGVTPVWRGGTFVPVFTSERIRT